MAEIFLHNKPIKSVFHLLGEHENDITYSVAWALAQSPAFLNRFIELATGKSIDTPNVVIRLQQHEQQGGITDIEIESPGPQSVDKAAARLNQRECARIFWRSDGQDSLEGSVG